MCSTGPLPWEVSTVSAREVGTGLVLKSLPPPLLSSSPAQTLCCMRYIQICTSAKLQMAACFGSFGCLQIAIRFSCNEFSKVEGLLLWGEGKSPELGDQKSGFRLWLCQTDSLLLSLSFPIYKWGITTSLPTSQCSWGSMNTTDCERVWGKLSTFLHLEDMTIPFREPVLPQRALVTRDDRCRQKAS